MAYQVRHILGLVSDQPPPPICTYGSLVFCVLHAFQGVNRIAPGSWPLRSVSAAWLASWPYFRSLFPVFGSPLFLCVSVRCGLALVIANRNGFCLTHRGWYGKSMDTSQVAEVRPDHDGGRAWRESEAIIGDVCRRAGEGVGAR